MKVRPSTLILSAVVLSCCLTGCGDIRKADAQASKPAANDVVAVAESKITSNTYHHPGFGWTMKIPEGWQAQSQQVADAIAEKGVQAIEKATGDKVGGGTVNLLHVKRSEFSQFTSAAQPYDVATDGPYAENQKGLFEIVLKTYADQKLKVVPEQREETVGGVTFTVLHMVVYTPDGKTEVFQQTMYDGLLGARSLTATVTSNNAADRATMLAAWRASTFDPTVWAKPSAAPAAAEKR
jgi:hypothetical protein